MEEQEAWIEVLHRRLIDRRREELATDLQGTQGEFPFGRCRAVTPPELMKEIRS